MKNKNSQIGRINSRKIVDEMKESYIDYAMSVIIARALPDVRDGLKPVHRRILYAMHEMGLSHTAKFRKSATVVGECFVKDTPILTNKGLVPIQEIKIGDQVYTQNNLKKVIQLYEMPKKPLLKVILENGISNIVTPSQKFKVLTEDWKFNWKEARNLAKNDYLVIKADYPEIKNLVKLTQIEKTHPQYLNENIAYLLGLFVSDGWITEDYGRKKWPRIGFTAGNSKNIAIKIVSILKQEFNYIPTIETKSYVFLNKHGQSLNNKQYIVRINRKVINQFFISNFSLQRLWALTKKIPGQVFSSPKNVIFSFISGLIEGDGFISSKRNLIHYGSISEKLINQLQILLQHQEIFSSKYIDENLNKSRFVIGRIVKKRYKFYYLEIHGESAVKLASKLNLANKIKNHRAYKLGSKQFASHERKGWNRYNLIPYAGKILFQELSKENIGSGWYQDISGNKFRMGIKYPNSGCKIRYSSDLWEKPLRKTQVVDWEIKNKLERIGSPLFEFLEKIIKNKIYFLRVSSIKKVAPKKTYDFEVENDHEFLANGMIVHNCMGKYHPHGDMAIYDSLVHMAQNFSLRYPLIQGQGNFGCFTKNTKVRLCNGRNLNFSNLIKEQKKGKRHWTFTFNPESQKIEITEIKNPRLTRKNEKIMEVTLDNGEKIRCTLDHRFMLRNGNYKKAIDLEIGDSLMPLYTKLYDGKEDLNLKEYEMVYQPIKNEWEFIHYLARHKGERNPFYGKRHTEESKRKMSEAHKGCRGYWRGKRFSKSHKEKLSETHKGLLKGRILSEDIKRKISQAHKGMRFSKKHRRNLALVHIGKKGFWAGKKRSKEDIEKFRVSHLGKKPSIETILKRVRKIRGKNHYNWQGGITPLTKRRLRNFLWKQTANEIRDRDNNTCQLCGFKGDNTKLPVHHLVPFKVLKNNDFKILITMCPSCHMKLEHVIRRMPGKQWQDPEFRKKIIEGVRAHNIQRIKENPDLMKELAQKAKISLHKNWQNPAYKEKVIKSKILGYVYSLLNKYSKVTPELYEEERTNNGTPRIKNALDYFNSFSEILVESQKHNHKVVKTRILREREDVYDLTVEPWHNFALAAGIFVHNSTDGDKAAAQRYTESKLSAIGEITLKDIEKNTVNFNPNYDATRKEPAILPSPLPLLLLNGSFGIAVGMSTNIPPHNISEVCQAIIYLIKHPKANTEALSKFIKGPDFPTGGIIYGQKEIIATYSQGKGPIVVRGKAEIVKDEQGKDQIIITEIPFQVQKSFLIENFANLIQKKRIGEIKTIRDESDREGMRIVIEPRKNASPQKILNQLYKFTDLQKTFHLNMLALTEGIQPKVLGLVEILNYFIAHRKEVIFRRTKFDLEKTKERVHILEGLNKAISKIDNIIKTIKASKNREEAKKNLIKYFKLTEIQALSILEMRLSQLARLERQKIEEELKEKLQEVKKLNAILKNPKKIEEIIEKELEELEKKFGDERRTKIFIRKIDEFTEEDLIPQKKAIITLTRNGYIKRVNPAIYKTQKRGGKGMLGIKTLGEDIVELFLSVLTHDTLFFFTDSGKVFKTMAYEIPEGTRIARGRNVTNFLEISSQEKILSLISSNKKDEEAGIKYLIMVTKKGIIKKTALEKFQNIRKTGLIAIKLQKNDLLKAVDKTAPQDEIILITKKGKAIRFKEEKIRSMGRATKGVKGVNLKKDDEIIGMDIITPKKSKKEQILVITENGYGKRTNLEKYRLQSRGGTGIKANIINQKTGNIVLSKFLTNQQNLIVISEIGKVIKISIDAIPTLGRATQGVRIMKIDKNDKVAAGICI